MKCKFNEKSLIFMLSFMLLGTDSRAQEWIQNIKNPRMPFFLQYSTQGLEAADAKVYSDKVEMEKTTGKVIIPISKSETFKQSISFDYNQTRIEQINKVPNSPVPEKLTEEKFGYQFSSKIDERRYFGMNTQIGSASDKPFFDWSVTEVSLTPYYYYDQTPWSSWVFLVNYSNQRSFLPHVPLPGLIYVYNNQEGFTLFAGIPVFGFHYKITEDLTMSYSTIMPWNHQFKISYMIAPPLQLYTEYKFAPETFKLIDYVDNEDRVILQDQKAIVGFNAPVTGELSLDVHGGLSFDRRIYQAKRPGSSEDWKEEIKDQTFFNVQLGIRI